MFQLDQDEYKNLRSQIATSNDEAGHGGRRYAPLVFTEHGALMAVSVLESSLAVEVNIFVVRALCNFGRCSRAMRMCKRR